MWRSISKLFSPGLLVVLGLAVATSIVVALLPKEEARGIKFWTFIVAHRDPYERSIAEWNRERPEAPFVVSLLHTLALERRMLSGFLSGTPTADLIEVLIAVSPKAFLGPLDQVGFLDLTDRIHAEGLYEWFNAPSFSPHTSRGRIFGLPHDVHPTVLAYRADLVEAAGIDVSQIETWEDFFRIMRPLMEDFDGDGRPDRYLLNLSEMSGNTIVGLVLQNDGVIFDEDDRPIFANERNARTLATLCTWITGPERATTYVQTLNAAGQQQLLNGVVVADLASDVLLGRWKREIPRLAGKLKLMPLPAWERGGRRTTVIAGGTMIGINKRSPYIEQCWEMAKRLYLSAEVAEQTYAVNMVISPVKSLWEEPFYHEPDPFYCGQAAGSLLIAASPDVPLRPSSPYWQNAFSHISDSLIALRAYAERNGVYDVEELTPVALRVLQNAQAELESLISRNVFLEGKLQGEGIL